MSVGDGGEAATDAVLWQRAVEGQAGAFGVLFERHADAVYTHCFRRTASWDAAEEMVSAVFLEAWRRRREVRVTTDSVLPWLLAVANNTLRNRNRSLRRHRKLLAALPAGREADDPAEEAAARLDDERAMRRIHAAFTQLGRVEQDVLSLVDWAGLSYADTAAALGVPVGTVRSRLSRARQRLRRLVTGEPDDRVGQPSPVSPSPGETEES